MEGEIEGDSCFLYLEDHQENEVWTPLEESHAAL
jgi:hypothetical protein